MELILLKTFPSIKNLSLLTSTIALGIQPIASHAGAFSLYGEVNGRNAGNYAAGAAADAEDASTLYYNPAGLVYLKGSQLLVGGTIVRAKAKLDDGSYTYLNNDLSTTLSLSGLSTSQTAAIPSLFYAKNVSSKLTWGVGVFAPFGLSTNWGDTSNARYAATLSKLEVIDVSPALGIRLSDNLSFGAAFDIQMAKVDFNSIGYFINPGFPIEESSSTNHGQSIGFGAHIGLLYQTNAGARYGLNYQSSVMHQFYGTSTLTGSLTLNGFDTSDSLFSDPISMPAQVTFSSMNPINDKLTLSTSVSYTIWSVFQNIALNNVVGFSGVPMDAVVSENFKDTWRVAVGAKYKYTEDVSFRMGVGYDQTPTNNNDRSLRLPDSDRIAIAAGLHYQIRKNLGLDFGWTHFFMAHTQVNNTTVSNTNEIYVNAGVNSNVDLLGAQIIWQIT